LSLPLPLPCPTVRYDGYEYEHGKVTLRGLTGGSFIRQFVTTRNNTAQPYKPRQPTDRGLS